MFPRNPSDSDNEDEVEEYWEKLMKNKSDTDHSGTVKRRRFE